jgi:hypothetical protein
MMMMMTTTTTTNSLVSLESPWELAGLKNWMGLMEWERKKADRCRGNNQLVPQSEEHVCVL